MKKTILALCYMLITTSIMAGTNLVGFQVDIPGGFGVDYKLANESRAYGASYHNISFDSSGTKLEGNSVSASYTFYSSKAFSGFYAGPGIALRKYELSETTILGVAKAEILLVDAHLNFGYSLLISDTVNISLGGRVGYGVGKLKYTLETTGISYDPEGVTFGINVSTGFSF